MAMHVEIVVARSPTVGIFVGSLLTEGKLTSANRKLSAESRIWSHCTILQQRV